ncbi:MAG: CPXCG motif-containing cysteine-rich protein [Thioalkalispiraceae bacterium]|jgi:hypothetical protein
MNNNLVQEYLALCPYCGESFTTLVDLSAGEQEYIEDCQVCCRPILFTIEIDSITEAARIHLRAENE